MSRTTSQGQRPSRWPFPPPPRQKKFHLRRPALGSMVADICLAAAWAAMIPGLMWLGVAGGF